MTEINLDRLSVLVVDDNSFVRLLLAEVIRGLGVEHVSTASSGEAAIEHMKTVARDPTAAGISVIDLVVIDVLMPEIDGLTLLRWIRSSESPDRFLPSIMISGAADLEVVASARQLGATEFLAKPFSGNSVAEKLMRTVFAPRQFVLAPAYFGPDRRRTTADTIEEHRVRTKDDVHVIYEDSAPDGVEEADVIFFHFQNRLAGKVGGFSLSGVPKLSAEAVAAADAKIEAVAGDYSDWVRESLKEVGAVLETLAAGGGDSAKLLGKLNRTAHEMRGQGGTFGYPLVTEFARSLYQATADGRIEVTDNHVEFYKAHIDAINVVMRGKVKGDGGETGRSLLQGLEAARIKYASAYA